jgi:hypothetical protein
MKSFHAFIYLTYLLTWLLWGIVKHKHWISNELQGYLSVPWMRCSEVKMNLLMVSERSWNKHSQLEKTPSHSLLYPSYIFSVLIQYLLLFIFTIINTAPSFHVPCGLKHALNSTACRHELVWYCYMTVSIPNVASWIQTVQILPLYHWPRKLESR